MVVREAARAAQKRKPKKIEIAIPPAVQGGTDVIEGRSTAIQNIISTTEIDPKASPRDAANLTDYAESGSRRTGRGWFDKGAIRSPVVPTKVGGAPRLGNARRDFGSHEWRPDDLLVTGLSHQRCEKRTFGCARRSLKVRVETFGRALARDRNLTVTGVNCSVTMFR